MSNHPNSEPPPSPAPSSDRSGRDYPLPTTRYSLLLLPYFRSGWAFLIPYLAAYLLYAWLRWPVNAAVGGSGEHGAGSWLPCLLHVYWALHAIHLGLGAIALRSWWKDSILKLQLPTSTGAHSAHLLSTAYRLLPWLCLALLFYIPGVYLEWPSDPWEHLRRINEWHILDTVTAHSAWMKSSYFIPYSLLSWATGLRQIFWLDFYYTGICLLLCWQYDRLARACDLGERASMMFVLLQALLFGNNIFSFYRYYGISSSIYAQLGAVALTRIVLEAAKNPQLSLRTFCRLQSTVHGLPPSVSPTTIHRQQSTDLPASAPAAGSLHTSILSLSEASATPSSWNPPAVYWLLPTVIALLPLIAFNHIQGIGIVGLSVAAVVIWRILYEKASRIWWVAGVTLALSVAAFLWWPRHPAIETIYRPNGWLTGWYGFNFFSYTSPSSDKAVQILGVFGVMNLVAGIYALRRNHVAGWLTVGPMIALALPFVALPFANSLANRSTDEIITFHRMIYAIPCGLAFTYFLSIYVIRFVVMPYRFVARDGGYFAIVILVAVLVSVAPNNPSYNRFWHFLLVTPQDLQLSAIISMAESTAVSYQSGSEYRLVTSSAVATIFNAIHPELYAFQARTIGKPAVGFLRQAIAVISIGGPKHNVEQLNLIQDPLASDHSAWIAVAGSYPEFLVGIEDFRLSSTALQNPLGRPSEVFTSTAIPVDPAKAYCLEISLKQSTETNAIAYLAVAWYSEHGDLLSSYTPQPLGAGVPVGWLNGKYSYFGLIAEMVPSKWTTYRTSFGKGEEAIIPSNAKFVRVGALLNHSEISGALINLTNVRLWEKSRLEFPANGFFTENTNYVIVAPTQRLFFSSGSQVGQASQHWPANQMASDLAGGKELMSAAHAAHTVSISNEELIIVLPVSGDRK